MVSTKTLLLKHYCRCQGQMLCFLREGKKKQRKSASGVSLVCPLKKASVLSTAEIQLRGQMRVLSGPWRRGGRTMNGALEINLWRPQGGGSAELVHAQGWRKHTMNTFLESSTQTGPVCTKIGSAKTDPVRFKWGFGEGRLKTNLPLSRLIKILYLRGENCLQNTHFYKQKGPC